jgi:hypothetical protein
LQNSSPLFMPFPLIFIALSFVWYLLSILPHSADAANRKGYFFIEVKIGCKRRRLQHFKNDWSRIGSDLNCFYLMFITPRF